MKPLKLHVKVTLLSTGITVIVLAFAVAVISSQMTRLVVQEQRERAELAAIGLAAETGRQQQPHDPDRARREAAIVRNARSSFKSVRIYELVGNSFIETAEAEGSASAGAIDKAEIAAIKRGRVARLELPGDLHTSEDDCYRVLAPIVSSFSGNVIGAVEVVVAFQPAVTTAEQFGRSLSWIVGAAVVVTLFCSYMMMLSFVYIPIRKLLHAMQHAESGDLSVEVEPRAPDEIGLLSGGFNRMIARLHVMTEEQKKQHEHLAEEVSRATRQVWTLTGRISEMERLAAAGQTAAQFAHEVGTPLNLIHGHVQLLKSRIKETKALEKLNIITEQIKRIEKIVRAMLDRTRPPAPRTDAIKPNDLVEAICEAAAPTIEARGIKLERRLDEESPAVSGDCERLQQAFLNLINNALDATAPGGALRVSTYYDPETHETTIEFADTGSGMSDDVAAHIFEPLYTTKERGRGTGLGLAIVQQVAKEHGGRVSFETKPGRGTTFRIILPALLPTEEKEAIAERV